MATYKAEFLSHHSRRRLRPQAAYALGPIFVWARWASRAPRVANALAHAPLVAGRILDRIGLDYRIMDSGCCGLAGGFGFERGAKYEVSVKAGQRILGPAIAEADDDTLILADGFSCRTQIRHLTGRRALHLAEMLSLALESRRSSILA